jgi:hypothetical protein
MEYTNDEICKLANVTTVKIKEIIHWDRIPFISLEENEFINICLRSQITLLFRGDVHGCNFFICTLNSIIGTRINTELEFAEFIQAKYNFKFEQGYDYKIFQLLNLKDVNEYKAFKDSPWGKDVFYKGMMWDNPKQVYNEAFAKYQEFIKSGFQDPVLYHEFQKSDFDSLDKFVDYKKKGYVSKEEYQFVEVVVPKLRTKLKQKIEQIQKDIDEAQNNGKDESMIHYNFNILEKRVEFLLRYSARDKSIQLDNLINDLTLMMEAANITFDIDEFKEWRRVRNSIVHDNEKIDKAKAKKALTFFNKINKYLDTIDDLLQKNLLLIEFEEDDDDLEDASDEKYYDNSFDEDN